MKNKKLLAVIFGCIGLFGCNGSSSDSSDTTTQTGTFIDSAVSNIDYETDSGSGVTNSDGSFEYQSGESVTFSIGTITFPTVIATDVITPLTLAGTTDVNDDTVINISRFLQTIDSDGDTSNGITISDTLKAANSTNGDTIDFTEDPDDFENDVASIIDDAGADELVSTSSALSHLEASLEDEDIDTSDVTPSILGTWYYKEYVDEDNYSYVVSVFIDDNYYLFAQLDFIDGELVTETDPNADVIEEGDQSDSLDSWSGFEFAQYSLDSSNYLFRMDDGEVVYDDNGGAGFDDLVSYDTAQSCLSSTSSALECEDKNYGRLIVSFPSFDEMTFTGNEFEDGGLSETYTSEYARQQSTSDNPLIGSWLSTDSSFDENSTSNYLLAFVFTDDGHYFHMEYDPTISDDNEDEQSGLEVGTYTLSSWTTTTVDGNTQHTATLTPTVLQDLNGDIGLSSIEGNTVTITIVGDTMTLIDEADSDTDDSTHTFTRQ